MVEALIFFLFPEKVMTFNIWQLGQTKLRFTRRLNISMMFAFVSEGRSGLASGPAVK